jgi:hypothetical protein
MIFLRAYLSRLLRVKAAMEDIKTQQQKLPILANHFSK